MNADVAAAARALLGARLRGHDVAAVITEVEAYAGPDDPASHAFTRTARSEIMYGEPGRLYVYRIHGHHCANVVIGPAGQAAAVLLRAARIVDGIDAARARRGAAVADDRLARGPGNLTRALGITMSDLGADLSGPTAIGLTSPRSPPARISAGPRVGVRRAADVAWRFWVTDDPTVSSYRRHPRAAPIAG